MPPIRSKAWLRATLPPLGLLAAFAGAAFAGQDEAASKAPASKPPAATADQPAADQHEGDSPEAEAAPAIEPGDGHKNTLRWSTASEVDNFGFDVYRGDKPDGPFARLTTEPIPGAGTSDLPSHYVWVDDAIAPDRDYYYYVESISMEGVRKRFTPVLKAPRKVPAGGEDAGPGKDAAGGDDRSQGKDQGEEGGQAKGDGEASARPPARPQGSSRNNCVHRGRQGALLARRATEA